MNDLDVIATCNPSQSHVELLTLIGILRERPQPRRVLEIGVHHGGSARVWWEFLRPDVLVGIDSDDALVEDEAWATGLMVVVGDSRNEMTTARARRLLGGPSGFSFIDGGHTYEEAHADWTFCLSVAAPGGAIALHNVCSDRCAVKTSRCDVPKLWAEIASRWAGMATTIYGGGPTDTGIGLVLL